MLKYKYKTQAVARVLKECVMQEKTKKYITIGVLVAIIVALATTLIVWALTPVGLNNKSEIKIQDAIDSKESIVIPVKMKNGVYTPSYQSFHSDLSLKELCDLTVKNDATIKFEIKDNKAYLCKLKDEKVVARCVLLKRNEIVKDLNYTASNMLVEGVVFPIHLTQAEVKEPITIANEQYGWSAVAELSVQTLSEWFNSVGIYELQIEGNIITCKDKVAGKNIAKVLVKDNLVAVKAL